MAGVKTGTSAKEADDEGNLPLFFKRPAVLDKERHATAALSSGELFTFAKPANSVPLNTIEFIEASKHYPIVFTDEASPLPVAILGLEKENYFVDKKGNWLDNAYLPAYVRQYPFMFYQPEGGDRFFLCIDEGAPHFRTKMGEGCAAFYEKGEPSAMAKRALEFCTAYQQHLHITRNFCKDLVAYKLLTPHSSNVTLASGKKLALHGFSIIDEAAFNALPDEVFLEFRQKGWLAFIYLAMASSSNWKQLVQLADKAA